MTFISCEIGQPFKIIFNLIWLSLLESFINYTTQVYTVIYIWKYKRKSKSDEIGRWMVRLERLIRTRKSDGSDCSLGKIRICVNENFEILNSKIY